MAVKSFTDWIAENNLPVTDPTVVDQEAPAQTDVDTGKTTQKENRVRTGWSGNYPPAYFSAQYPHKYVNPHKATTDLDAQNIKK